MPLASVCRKFAAALLFVATALAPAVARAQTAPGADGYGATSASGVAPTQGLVRPARSFALEEDGTALAGNPAGLVASRGLGLSFLSSGGLGSHRPAGTGLFLSSTLGPLGSGFAAEWVNHAGVPCRADGGLCARRLTTGLALRLGPAATLGASYHSFSSDESAPVDHLHSWDLGLLIRPAKAFSIGLAALDVNQPRFGSVDLPRRFVAAVGVRPFGERLTLALDATFRQCTGAADASALPAPACGGDHPLLAGTAEAQLLDGLRLVGQLGAVAGQGRSFAGQVGLEVGLGHLSVRSGLGFAQARDSNPDLSVQLRLSQERWPSAAPVRARAVVLDLGRALEKPRPGVLDLVLGSSAHRDPLASTLAALARLARDPGVQAVALRAGDLPLGAGRIEELRSGIEDLRRAGKKVLFSLESGGDLEYYLSSAADRIVVAPQAVLQINGFSATALFAGAGLDKLGVKAEFFRVGQYKNAPDLFTRSDMSGEQREVQDALLDDLFGRYVRTIGERRHLEAAKFRKVLDRGLLRPQEAIDEGLVDGLAYPDQLEEEVGKLLGRSVALEKGSLEPPLVHDGRWGPRPRIAVIRVEGDIVGGDSHRGPLGVVELAGADTIARQIRAAADDASVAAIVVRIDSPGGDGTASDLIWRELVRARREKRKPVVASMGDVAASGGYYVAAGADEVFAEPSTVTGSIGVFIGHFDASALYGKLGLSMVTLKRGESADLFSTARLLTPRERESMQRWVDGFYGQFVQVVAEGRHLAPAQVDAVARGRVWSGTQAHERGLVDHLGGLDAAIAAACARAGVVGEDVRIDDEAAASVDVSELALSNVFERALPGAAATGWVPQAVRALTVLGAPGSVRARLPFDLEVH